MEVAGPLGTPLGLAQRKRASPRGEAKDTALLLSIDAGLGVGWKTEQQSLVISSDTSVWITNRVQDHTLPSPVALGRILS